MSPRDQPRSLALLLLSLVGLVAVGLWTHSVVRKTVRDRTEDRLRLVMNSMYEGLNAWLDGQHSLVRWIAAEPAVRGDLLEIADRAPGLTAEQLRRLPARSRLVERLHDVLESHGYENFAFISPDESFSLALVKSRVFSMGPAITFVGKRFLPTQRGS